MKLNQILENIGLNEKEAKTYLANLELGPAKVQEIANKSSVDRVNTYYILDNLIEKGIISKTYKKDKMAFVAAEPDRLLTIMEGRTKDLRKALPELKALSKTGKRPAIRYFEGVEGIKAIYEDSLTSKSGIIGWNNTSNLETFAPEYFHEYYKRRAAKKISARGIINDSPISREYDAKAKEELRNVRLVPEDKMKIKPECYIYDDKIAFMSLNEKIGVIIESKDIAEAQRALFELAWEGAGKYEK